MTSASDAASWHSSRMTLQSVNCNGLSSQTIVNVHLIILRSNAAVWQSDNFVNTFDRSKSDAIFLTLKQSSVHLMTSILNAVLTVFSNNRQRAFNSIAIKCSNSNINCLSSDRDEIECSMSDITFNRQCIWW